MLLSPLERQALLTAFRADGNCDGYDIDSKRVRTRTLASLEAKKLIYSRHIDGRRPITPAGQKLAASLLL